MWTVKLLKASLFIKLKSLNARILINWSVKSLEFGEIWMLINRCMHVWWSRSLSDVEQLWRTMELKSYELVLLHSPMLIDYFLKIWLWYVKNWVIRVRKSRANGFFVTPFSTHPLSTNKFCLNVLSTSTTIYSQSKENTNNFFTDFHQRKQISRKGLYIY